MAIVVDHADSPRPAPTIADVSRTAQASRRSRGAGYRIGITVLVLVASILASGIAYAVAKAVDAGDTSAGVVAAAVMSAGIALFGALARRGLPAFERRLMTASHIGWARGLGVAAGVAVLARIGVGAITAIGEQIDPSLCRKLAELDLEPTPLLWQKIVLAGSLVILAPLGEELLFRTILLRGFVRVMPFLPAAAISGTLFGAAHLQYWSTWPVLVGVGLFGVANCFVYRRYGYPTAVAAHALFNAVAAVFLFVELPTTDPQQCP